MTLNNYVVDTLDSSSMDLCKDIINSNLPDDTKIKLIGIVQNNIQKIQYVPVPVTQPDNWWYKPTWISAGDVQYPSQETLSSAGYDDSGWIRQQRLDAIADVESILHPTVIYNA